MLRLRSVALRTCSHHQLLRSSHTAAQHALSGIQSKEELRAAIDSLATSSSDAEAVLHLLRACKRTKSWKLADKVMSEALAIKPPLPAEALLAAARDCGFQSAGESVMQHYIEQQGQVPTGQVSRLWFDKLNSVEFGLILFLGCDNTYSDELCFVYVQCGTADVH
jgi:hypothetical protein